MKVGINKMSDSFSDKLEDIFFDFIVNKTKEYVSEELISSTQRDNIVEYEQRKINQQREIRERFK